MTVSSDMKKEMDIAQYAYARGVMFGFQLSGIPAHTMALLLRELFLLQTKADADLPHVKQLLKMLRRDLRAKIR